MGTFTLKSSIKTATATLPFFLTFRFLLSDGYTCIRLLLYTSVVADSCEIGHSDVCVFFKSLASYWSHIRNILSPWLPIGHMFRIFFVVKQSRGCLCCCTGTEIILPVLFFLMMVAPKVCENGNIQRTA